MPRLTPYGELMCNPSRYSYTERGMANKGLCFGAMFDNSSVVNHTTSAQDAKQLPSTIAESLFHQLRVCGFFVTASPDNRTLTIRLNPTLVTMVEKNDVRCVPFIDFGPLLDVCIRNQYLLMSSDLEGVVVNGAGFLKKWNSGDEDESKGLGLLNLLTSGSNESILELAGVDISRANCLLEGSRRKKHEVMETKAEKTQPYSEQDVAKAIESAKTKFDSFDTYFQRQAVFEIDSAVKKEVENDLNAKSLEEIKCIDGFLGKHIGTSFTEWKKRGK